MWIRVPLALMALVAAASSARAADLQFSFPESAGGIKLSSAIVEVAKTDRGEVCRMVRSSGDAIADRQPCAFLQGYPGRRLGVQEWPVWIVPAIPPGYAAATPVGKTALLTTDDYPSQAILGNKEGIVIIKMVITETGAVESCKTLGGSGSQSLDAAPCVAALKRFRFNPATIDGKPVRDIRVQVVTFWMPRR